MRTASGPLRGGVAEAAARSWRRIYCNSLSLPFWGVHVLAIVGVAITGVSWWGVLLALALYLPRMFFVTGAYQVAVRQGFFWWEVDVGDMADVAR